MRPRKKYHGYDDIESLTRSDGSNGEIDSIIQSLTGEESLVEKESLEGSADSSFNINEIISFDDDSGGKGRSKKQGRKKQKEQSRQRSRSKKQEQITRQRGHTENEPTSTCCGGNACTCTNIVDNRLNDLGQLVSHVVNAAWCGSSKQKSMSRVPSIASKRESEKRKRRRNEKRRRAHVRRASSEYIDTSSEYFDDVSLCSQSDVSDEESLAEESLAGESITEESLASFATSIGSYSRADSFTVRGSTGSHYYNRRESYRVDERDETSRSGYDGSNRTVGELDKFFQKAKADTPRKEGNNNVRNQSHGGVATETEGKTFTPNDANQESNVPASNSREKQRMAHGDIPLQGNKDTVNLKNVDNEAGGAHSKKTQGATKNNTTPEAGSSDSTSGGEVEKTDKGRPLNSNGKSAHSRENEHDPGPSPNNNTAGKSLDTILETLTEEEKGGSSSKIDYTIISSAGSDGDETVEIETNSQNETGSVVHAGSMESAKKVQSNGSMLDNIARSDSEHLDRMSQSGSVGGDTVETATSKASVLSRFRNLVKGKGDKSKEQKKQGPYIIQGKENYSADGNRLEVRKIESSLQKKKVVAMTGQDDGELVKRGVAAGDKNKSNTMFQLITRESEASKAVGPHLQSDISGMTGTVDSADLQLVPSKSQSPMRASTQGKATGDPHQLPQFESFKKNSMGKNVRKNRKKKKTWLRTFKLLGRNPVAAMGIERKVRKEPAKVVNRRSRNDDSPYELGINFD